MATRPLEEIPSEQRIIRRPEVEARTGISRAHIYALMRQGQFPQSISLGKRAVGWSALEINQWIADRLTQREP